MGKMIIVEQQKHVIIITVNRPESRNALSSRVLNDLALEIDKLHQDKNIRALIITGAGDKAFCAGADLKERQGMDEDKTLGFVKNIQSIFQSIAELAMPTIAAINGDAFGGGLELALACDLRVAAQTARMGLSECSLGIIPGAGGTQRLPRIVGIAKANELIFMAKILNSEQACAIGLVNQIAKSSAETLDLALEMANTIANNAPLAVRAAKRSMLFVEELKYGLAREIKAYETILASKDRLEGLKAFSEKRAPQFTGC